MKFRQTLYFKIMIFFSGILILLFSITCVIFDYSKRAVIEKSTKYIAEQAEYTFTMLNNDMDRIKQTVGSFAYDKDIIKMTYVSEYSGGKERGEILNALAKKIDLLANLSQYIKSVRIDMPKIGKSIDSNFPQRVRDFDIDRYNEISSFIGSSGQNLYVNDEEISLVFNKITADSYMEIDEYIIEVVLDPTLLRQLLDSQSIYKNSICLLLNNANHEIVQTSTSAYGKPESIDSVLNANAGKSNDGTINTRSDVIFSCAVDSAMINMVLAVPISSIHSEVGTFTILFVIFILVAIVATCIYLIYCYKIIRKPFKEITSATYDLELGNFDVHFANYHNSEFSVLAKRFEKMASRLNQLINQVYRQEALVKQSELKQLQSQINPHFLYNSFFILSRMIKSQDNEQAGIMLDHLSRYFEYITRDAQATVTLEKEISHMAEYIDIQKIRFCDHFIFSQQELPFCFSGLLIPRLTLQPIVENYFKYGMSEGAMNLSLKFEEDNDKIRIIFQDDSSKMEEEYLTELNQKLIGTVESTEITGLINISHRLQLMFGEECGIELENIYPAGLKTSLTIALTKRDISQSSTRTERK